MKKRAHKMSHREPEHMESGYSPSHSKGSSSGSGRHSESIGPGPRPGAGEMTFGAGPGAAARGIRPSGTENPTRPVPTGKAPKGMKTYAEE